MKKSNEKRDADRVEIVPSPSAYELALLALVDANDAVTEAVEHARKMSLAVKEAKEVGKRQ